MNLKFLGAVQRSCNAKTAKFGFLAFFLALIFLPLATSAAGTVPTIDSTLQGTGIPMVSLTVFLLNILRIFFGILGVLAVFLIIYGGFIWMSSQGDPDKVKKAKQIIYNTIIGLIVIFSAFAISSFLMAWLSGWGAGGGGGGGTNIPGGNGDWSRSAIGAGPIESVYPKPNAVNVPINTRIAVTFKENIKPESICDVADGETCNGNDMKNIEICEISATGTDCLPGSVYLAAAYAGSPVYQVSANDKKTFVIYPKTYLGIDDNQNRTFKVLLKEEITAEATNKSIFDGLRKDYYHWAFKTNGVLDFSPPEIVKSGLYPNPDDVPDEYALGINALGTQSGTGSASIAIPNLDDLKFDAPTMIGGVPYLGTTLTGIPLAKESPDTNSAPIDSLKLNVTGPAINGSGNIAFTIDSAQGSYVSFDAEPDAASILGITYSTAGNCVGISRCLLVENNPNTGNQVVLGNSGIKIVGGTRDFSSTDVKGSKWSFTVSPAVIGDSFIFKNGNAETNFIFAGSDRAAEFTKATTVNGLPANISYTSIKSASPAAALSSLADALNAKLGSLITASVSDKQVNITPKAAGANAMSFSTQSPALTIDSNLSGTERQVDRQALPIGSKLDPYNNSVFRVTFNKAINPINIDSFIKVNIAGQEVLASTTITNQYKTVELMGTKPCGVNSCGKMMYCWVDPNTDQNKSIPGNITIAAASLKTCVGADQNSADNEWCKTYGGTCKGVSASDTPLSLAGKDYGRCKQSSGLYYPQASAVIDGLTDMANNSFNGNFNKAVKSEVGVVGGASLTLKGSDGTVTGYNETPQSPFLYKTQIDPTAGTATILRGAKSGEPDVVYNLPVAVAGNYDLLLETSNNNDLVDKLTGTIASGDDYGYCRQGEDLVGNKFYHQIQVVVDGNSQPIITVLASAPALPHQFKNLISLVNLTAGNHEIRIRFLNDCSCYNNLNNNTYNNTCPLGEIDSNLRIYNIFLNQVNVVGQASAGGGNLVGNAEGKHGTTTPGVSGQLIYSANDPKHFKIWGSNITPTFSYANDGDVSGDSFIWSFFLSTQIDRNPPLISQIIPYGGASFGSGANETFRDPVRLVFNGLMRLATLKPGWGYGTGRADPAWNVRYLLLKTLTSGANPVGYWINSLNLDEGDFATGLGKGDGLADYTVADIEHNAYDQAVNYGPMGANGLESITQNCLLPGSGPANADAGKCVYISEGVTSGCVTDLGIPENKRVTSTNPSSYSSLACKDIDGAVVCATGKECKVHYATSTDSLNGSWIIAKDLTADGAGKTGCCFGRCCEGNSCSN